MSANEESTEETPRVPRTPGAEDDALDEDVVEDDTFFGGRATLEGNRPLCVKACAFFIEAACCEMG